MSTPPANTAQVPVASAASWAAASMPRAIPEATTRPALPKAPASVTANFRPSADALRAPTIAIISCDNKGTRSQHADDRGRRIEGGEAARKLRLARRDKLAAEFAQSLDLPFHIGNGRHLEICDAAPLRQSRYSIKRRTCGTKAGDQNREGSRPHVLGSRKTQPIQPFPIRKIAHLFDS